MTQTPSTKPRRPRATGLLATAAAIVGGAALGFGGDGWIVVLCVAIAGLIPLVSWLRRSDSAHSFRYPLLILSAPMALGIYEAWLYEVIPESVAESLDVTPSQGEPDINFDYDLPGVIHTAWPNLPEGAFARGAQMQQCLIYQSVGIDQPICHQFENLKSEQVKEKFQQAITAGSKTDENMYYMYARFLIETGAPAAEVKEVIMAWKRNFPRSKGPPGSRKQHQTQ